MKENIVINIIPSKSFAHRAYICNALSKEKGNVICPLDSMDIKATKECVVTLESGGALMECGDSGSTLRFMMPVMGALGRKGIFMTKGRLKDRPLSPMREELERHGCKISPMGEEPIVIDGQLKAGDYVIPGDVSSQFISGLLMALPLLKDKSTIMIPGKLESSGYVNITTEILTKYGITWIKKMNDEGTVYSVLGNQEYKAPKEIEIEGDWSNAAFWFVAGAIGSVPVTVKGLNMHSVQGDRAILDIIKDFGGEVLETADWVAVKPSLLNGIEVDVSAIPDLAPIIALMGAYASGTTKITGAGRLHFKESDRLASITSAIKALGGKIKKNKDGLTIKGSGGKLLRGGIVYGSNDHRIVMMSAIGSLVCSNKVNIQGKEAVYKSYPGFFEEMKKCGLGENII